MIQRLDTPSKLWRTTFRQYHHQKTIPLMNRVMEGKNHKKRCRLTNDIKSFAMKDRLRIQSPKRIKKMLNRRINTWNECPIRLKKKKNIKFYINKKFFTQTVPQSYSYKIMKLPGNIVIISKFSPGPKLSPALTVNLHGCYSGCGDLPLVCAAVWDGRGQLGC